MFLARPRTPDRRRVRKLTLALEPLEPRQVMTAGALDPTFGTGGIVTTNMGTDAGTHLAEAIHIDANGNSVVAGNVQGATTTVTTTTTTTKGKKTTTTTTTTTVVDQSDFGLARYLPNGALDLTFGADDPNSSDPSVRLGKVQVDLGGIDVVREMAVDSEGRFILVGNTGTETAVARFLPDGSLDASFSGDGKHTFKMASTGSSFGRAVAIQPGDNKILIGARHSTSTGYVFALSRLNVNGTLDASFGVGGIVTTDVGPASDTLEDIAIQKVNGQSYVVAAGQSLDSTIVADSTTTDGILARYHLGGTTAGALDSAFGTGGIKRVDGSGNDDLIFSHIAIQGDSKIVAGGYLRAFETDVRIWEDYITLARFGADGSADASFGAGGMKSPAIGPVGVNNTTAYLLRDLIVHGDSIFVTGQVMTDLVSSRDTFVARFDSAGSLDSTFGNGGVVIHNLRNFNTPNDEAMNAIAITSDGEIMLAGWVQETAGSALHWALVRLEGDESLATDLAVLAMTDDDASDE